MIGPLHEDVKFIGVAAQHWHPDRRFVSKRWLNEEGPNHWATILTPFWKHPLMQERNNDPEVVEGGRRRLRCRRTVGSFCNPRTGAPPNWLKTMEPAYAHERLRDGHICPHRGISCRGVVAENDGVVCPGHGLKWNLETGRLVSRVGQTFAAKLF